MKKNCICYLIVSLLLIAAGYSHAQTVQVRLVEAFNSNKKSVDSSLQDVASLLKKNLPYNSFAQLGYTTVIVPTQRPVAVGGYRLTVEKAGKSLAVKVYKGSRLVFQSNVRLKANSPVIFGGFSGHRGKIMFILTR